jgi:hypothetical protein
LKWPHARGLRCGCVVCSASRRGVAGVAFTKVKLFERIRRDSWQEGLGIQALAGPLLLKS